MATSVPWQPCEKAGWPAVQVKHMFETALGKMLQPQPASDDNVEAPYIKSLHVQWRGVSFEDLPTMWASPTDIEQLELRVGDLMVCEGGEVGRGALVLNDPPPLCIFQNALHRVRARKLNDVRYLNYCLKQASEAGWFDVLCNRATIAHFTVEKFRELRIHRPSSEAQRLIANYLDRETARIDGLIAEKERMLALLEEKRAALISRVVTRGLDPDAPLKPSGQEWLGEIPAHWEVRTLKRASSRIDTGTTPAASFMDGSLPSDFTWFTPSDFVHGGVIAESNRKIPQEAVDEGEAKVFPAHSLMVIGIGATLGKVASCRARFSVNQQINVITPLESVRWDYLLYVLQGYEHVFRAHANSATLPILNQERLGVIRAPVPPLTEQDEIVTGLNESRAEYAEVNQLLGDSISLLKERRAALITSAVTGQIPLEEMTV